MSKKIFIGICVVMIVVIIVYTLLSSGIVTFETVGENEETPASVVSAEDLQDECFYIWHDSHSTLEEDLEGTSEADVFNLCPAGHINWAKRKWIGHTLWFSTDEDYLIPTLYPGDKLIYISMSSVPYDGIEFERFADYGYTIGVSNLEADKSGHYRIVYDSDNGYEGYINSLSDAVQIPQFFRNVDVFLESIGNISVKNGLISDGGTVLSLDKDGEYLVKWYKGTYRNDFKMTANQHAYGSIESFTTYDFEFVDNGNSDLSNIHSCVVITIPEWFKTGYYYINGKGFFRYVNVNDLTTYNGLAYDPNVNWNDPIILYDEHGFVVYDPSTGLDKRDSTAYVSGGSTLYRDDEKNASINGYDGAYTENMTPEMYTDMDAGAEGYESFTDEAVVYK